MNNLVINFWQDIPSLHQESLIRNLAEMAQVNLIVEGNSLQRKLESGWDEQNFGNASLIVAPSNDIISEIFSKEKSINIFSGISFNPMVSEALKLAFKKKRIIGIQSESYNSKSLLVPLRKIRSYYHHLVYKNHIKFILSIGREGVNWFKNAGFNPNQIFEFGYFTNTPSLNGHQQNQIFTIIFVGKLDDNKGLDLLFNSMAQLNDLQWKLNIIGDGPLAQDFNSLASRLGISDSIKFSGVLNNKNTIRMIESADLLVLPSKYKEGWGAVINESLMVGTQVLCSDICGAACLFSNMTYGKTFKTKSVKSLTENIGNLIEKGPLPNMERERIINWSNCIDGKAAANYLINIIEHILFSSKRPLVPWSNNKSITE